MWKRQFGGGNVLFISIPGDVAFVSRADAVVAGGVCVCVCVNIDIPEESISVQKWSFSQVPLPKSYNEALAYVYNIVLTGCKAIVWDQQVIKAFCDNFLYEKKNVFSMHYCKVEIILDLHVFSCIVFAKCHILPYLAINAISCHIMRLLAHDMWDIFWKK